MRGAAVIGASPLEQHAAAPNLPATIGPAATLTIGATVGGPDAPSPCQTSVPGRWNSTERGRGCGAAGAATPSSSGLVYIARKDTSIALDGVSRRLSRMRRGVVSAARFIQDQMQDGGRRYRAAFVTLTYRVDQDWDAGDIRKVVKHYRHWGQRRRACLGIIWVAETHGGGGLNHGKIHYHLVIFLPRGLTPPMPDKQGWWRKGMSNCKWARSPVGYLAKCESPIRGLAALPDAADMTAKVCHVS